MKKIYNLLIPALMIFVSNTILAQTTYTYTGKPRFQILATQNNATLGIVKVELFPNIAPRHVRNFDSLVSQKFYDTTAFHRVVPGFVIQGGDPNSRSGSVSTWGFGQPGQPTVKAEFSVARHDRGILSAARSSNINSATSQFFICVAAAYNLNGNYSVYGRVTQGMNIVDQIVATPTVFGTQRPVNKIEMFVTYIGSNDTVPLAPTLLAPKKDSANVDTFIVQLKWAKVQDAVFYHLDVARDSLFTDTVKSIDQPTLTFNLFSMMKDTVYYWRVKANNGGHTSVSPTWHFRTGEKPVLNPAALQAMTTAGLRTVFPNPVKDKVTFSNNEPGDLIQIFDLKGRLVLQAQAADKNVVMSVAELTRGNYIYKISNGQKVITEGKIVLAD